MGLRARVKSNLRLRKRWARSYRCFPCGYNAMLRVIFKIIPSITNWAWVSVGHYFHTDQLTIRVEWSQWSCMHIFAAFAGEWPFYALASTTTVRDASTLTLAPTPIPCTIRAHKLISLSPFFSCFFSFFSILLRWPWGKHVSRLTLMKQQQVIQ